MDNTDATVYMPGTDQVGVVGIPRGVQGVYIPRWCICPGTMVCICPGTVVGIPAVYTMVGIPAVYTMVGIRLCTMVGIRLCTLGCPSGCVP